MNAVKVLKFRFLLGLAAAFLPLAAVAVTHEVKVGSGGLKFSPNDLTIQVGDTVHWSSTGGSHDVVADDGSFSSGNPSSSINFSKTFNSAGEILYYCTVHSSPGRNINSNMNGRITVQSGGGGSVDLSVQSVDAQNGSYAPGDSIPIDFSIKNIGDATSDNPEVTFFASIDSTIMDNDIIIGSSILGSLAADQTKNFSVNAAFPTNINEGDYFIGLFIELADSNNANNTGVDSTPITVKTADSFVINNGLNDTWRDIDTRGQGFFVTVFPDIQKMFVGWFTYDVVRPDPSVTAILGEPGHRWVTAFGSYTGDTATLDIELTQGGIFDSGNPAPTQGPYGTMKVEFANCSEGEVTYNIPSVGRSGSVPITRVANDNVALCEAFATP